MNKYGKNEELKIRCIECQALHWILLGGIESYNNLNIQLVIFFTNGTRECNIYLEWDDRRSYGLYWFWRTPKVGSLGFSWVVLHSFYIFRLFMHSTDGKFQRLALWLNRGKWKLREKEVVNEFDDKVGMPPSTDVSSMGWHKWLFQIDRTKEALKLDKFLFAFRLRF